MPSHPEHPVSRFVRALAWPDLAAESDADLLRRYAAGRDEAAFTALVGRYAPMVLGVCRRVVGHADDADDAFQVTFLLLARRAAHLRSPSTVGNWLYGVAVRSALKARTARRREAAARQELWTRPPPAGGDDDLRELVDRAVVALPAKYRLPVVLCELQGRSRKDAAAELGLSEGTLSSRLAAARLILARRIGRAFSLSAVAAATAVPQPLFAAAVGGASAPSAPITPAVQRLLRGVTRDMFLAKFKVPAALAAVVTVFAIGYALAGQPAPPPKPSAGPDPAAAGAKPPAAHPLLTLTGSDSGITEAEFVRVSDAAEWKKVWLRHQGVSDQEQWTTRRPLMDVDFDRCEVIGLFRGKGTNRRGVRVESISEDADRITIRYDDITFQTSGGAVEATAYGILLLPASGKTVVLERDTQRIKGRPPEWKEEARLKATR